MCQQAEFEMLCVVHGARSVAQGKPTQSLDYVSQVARGLPADGLGDASHLDVSADGLVPLPKASVDEVSLPDLHGAVLVLELPASRAGTGIPQAIHHAAWLGKYIPVGCLEVSVDETRPSSPELRSLVDPSQGWLFFARPRDDIPVPLRLPASVQDDFLKLPPILPFVGLWRSRWIQMAISPSSGYDRIARIRIYILPQDVDRRFINLTPELMKATSRLISSLNYSPACWGGAIDADRQNRPTPNSKHDLPEDQGSSPLAMFNSVPSPDPHPELEPDPDTRDAMQCLLDSQLCGLTTKLYPYQGRSAALMVQREEQPGRTIDPRLRSALDQEAKPWYYDEVSGSVLREPRYYDGLRGGILAEEMGTGKTLICLALILSTKHEPTKAPEPFVAETPARSKKASLMDMAAATANRRSIPWRPYFEAYAAQYGYEFQHCIRALTHPENRALYKVRNILVEPRKSIRIAPLVVPPKEVYLSCTSLIIAPDNLVKQWQSEIDKHTTGLQVLVLAKKEQIPPITVLLDYDIILFSETRFERIQRERMDAEGKASDIYCPLEHIRFKRCIIDEGHKLGNRGWKWKSDVMMVIDRLEIAARWVVTGTPSRGLYGVDPQPPVAGGTAGNGNARGGLQSTKRQEREDLQRIGNLAIKFLKVRPWANTKEEAGDSVADWKVYVMHPSRHAHGHGPHDCLKRALDSLIIRHRLSDISTLLPPVDEKIVLLDGSYQDKLSLNLFSMMIIFNSVQSQRTDMDYFFHERQRKSLIQLVKNLKQASFFGGVFFSADDIAKSINTAEEFLQKKAVKISRDDENLLTEAIAFAKIAAKNKLKDISNKYHTMPLYLEGFPGGSGRRWSLDDDDDDDDEGDGKAICTDAGMIYALQRFLNPCLDAPTSLRVMIESGRLDRQGEAERSHILLAATDTTNNSTAQPARASSLAGNTPLGEDHHSKPKSGVLEKAIQSLAGADTASPGSHVEIAEPLAKTRIISTISAKLSYLIDAIIRYQDEEQIIVFYENNNIAYYLASVLEILQIQHLIYARAGLDANRRAQYVTTFTHSPRFRVLLMDISQAAFGLDMRSASRIYFISPVLNPQVEAQAIGRARRISQQKPVSVETLVLRGSIEEVIVNRRRQMTHAEHSKVKSILDDRHIYQWILNAKIIPMPADDEDGVAQTALLTAPQSIFGRGFGRQIDPNEGLVMGNPEAKAHTNTKLGAIGMDEAVRVPFKPSRGLKRPQSPSPSPSTQGMQGPNGGTDESAPKRRLHVAFTV
ncbi:P-loop containing nucleoside triphosphate hydrolase protein [Durotheca rogersii]|uniref:P-loop containing nucleoside triphosphate hydrolase protein n=1 Tax=Durotheca rogersii TaxID=419775 RepID=UPI00221E932E|nr:P-loop containing nucleoside triphosphate hydrolase protein [Durotheca rogersii]KAI5862601.1 P-loop containing nucleoside triphosphate hydrolase protein [Durotheca rogersii]